MHLRHLTLTHFRNYKELNLDFSANRTLIQGENAQGKTNLLEAIFMLATSKPVHANSEREIVDWAAGEEPIPYSRISGEVVVGEVGWLGDEVNGTDNPQTLSFSSKAPKSKVDTTQIEILLTPRDDGVNFKKQVKINGVAKRAVDLVGLMRAVLFLPEDVKLVDGSPGERRRYLDIALCQLDKSYTRALSDYQKVVEQRNSLLKSFREQDASPKSPAIDAQLGFWDEKLIHHGSIVIAKRHNFVQQLTRIARQLHGELSGQREQLSLHYLPSFNPGSMSEADFSFLDNERASEFDDPPETTLDPETAAAAYRAKLNSRRAREIDAGNTLYGPHRDDLRFVANRRDLRLFGSRGQQRSAALSIKLAEVRTMTEITGTAPILLLDDVMSELDARRRAMLTQALDSATQAILTTTDWEDYTEEFQAGAQRLVVKGGKVENGTTIFRS